MQCADLNASSLCRSTEKLMPGGTKYFIRAMDNYKAAALQACPQICGLCGRMPNNMNPHSLIAYLISSNITKILEMDSAYYNRLKFFQMQIRYVKG